jgi:hypothetical protein
MNIYKGLLMMQGYLTTVEREEAPPRECAEASGCGEGPGGSRVPLRERASPAPRVDPMRGLTPGCA